MVPIIVCLCVESRYRHLVFPLLLVQHPWLGRLTTTAGNQVNIKTALLFACLPLRYFTRKLLMPAVPDVLGTIGRMEN